MIKELKEKLTMLDVQNWDDIVKDKINEMVRAINVIANKE